MPNIIDQMEEYVFNAQLARLSHTTNQSVNSSFMQEMYLLVKERYLQELEHRKIELHGLDGARLDEIVSYIFYYHIFHTSHLNPDTTRKIEHDENYRNMLIHDVSVNIVINEHLNIDKISNTSAYSPEIVAYNMACSYSLYMLNNFRGNNRRMHGINNLFKKALVTVKSVIELLAAGNSCDAVILWRHLHELECVLIILCTKGDDLFFRYIQHMEYFDMENNPNAEQLQQRLSEECKAFGIKERNAFINYGWMEHIEEFRKGFGKEYRLNFKDGLQKLAGQSSRHPAYASASKILHPSAWVVTIRDDKFYLFTVFELYRSMLNIVDQIKNYTQQYRSYAKDISECDGYGSTVDGYLKMIAHNNQIITEKFQNI